MPGEHGTYAGYINHYLGPDADRRACYECRVARARYQKTLNRDKYVYRQEKRYIDATGTRRRIRALVRMGWSLAEIGRRAKPDAKEPSGWVYNLTTQDKVHVNTAARIKYVYDRISHRQGPSSAAMKRGIRAGWAPPMAWDDIDDPNDHPKGYLKCL